MGLTIEDMLTISKDKYEMQLIGGSKGWSNSISWILLVEDRLILKNFKGRDLAVTTGMGFDTPEKLTALVEGLVEVHASGLIINIGPYISEIPDSVIAYCNDNDFPLLTVPWNTTLYDMIKDLSLRVLLQSVADEQISNALIHAIEDPTAKNLYEKDLLPYFDVDGSFQMVLMSTGDLDVMDTVERRRIDYQLRIYLENITHNGHFFYYDSCFALVLNDVTPHQASEILHGFVKRTMRKMPQKKIAVGVGSLVTDISNLSLSYRRARVAVDSALRSGKELLFFDEMGIYRLLGMVSDQKLIKEMGEDTLLPILEHDREHGTNYVETLKHYLLSNGSIQSVSEATFTHRNTVIYRLNNIKKLLDCSFDTPEERIKYLIACMICSL